MSVWASIGDGWQVEVQGLDGRTVGRVDVAYGMDLYSEVQPEPSQAPRVVRLGVWEGDAWSPVAFLTAEQARCIAAALSVAAGGS